TELSYRLGLASQDRMERVIAKTEAVAAIRQQLREISIEPGEANPFLATLNSSPISEKQKAEKLLLRPDVELPALAATLEKLKPLLTTYKKEDIEQASIQVKYDVYIEKEKELVKRMSQLEDLEIPDTFDYKKIQALGNEAREKLVRVKPRTLGQASRISGINPSDVQILMVYMGR
ncbi:MAG: tRNA uridine-5-carboxymethylaminomethyl(34) synthesis enzyme MnmG, partial [Flavitalea sp.]